MRGLAMIAAVQLLAACSDNSPLQLLADATAAAGKVSDQAAARAAQTLDAYCAAIPAAARSSLRDAVDSRTARGKIAVWCDGDPPLTLGKRGVGP